MKCDLTRSGKKSATINGITASRARIGRNATQLAPTAVAIGRASRVASSTLRSQCSGGNESDLARRGARKFCHSHTACPSASATFDFSFPTFRSQRDVSRPASDE